MRWIGLERLRSETRLTQIDDLLNYFSNGDEDKKQKLEKEFRLGLHCDPFYPEENEKQLKLFRETIDKRLSDPNIEPIFIQSRLHEEDIIVSTEYLKELSEKKDNG